MSSVSVIIVSYYTGSPLWLAIDSALAEPECKELILVNNGNIAGDEKRLAKLAEHNPRVNYITGQGNVGFAKACNLGAASATGDYILLLNPDSMLPEGSLTRAVSVMTRYPEKTLAGCYLINPDGSEQRGSRRAILTPKNAVSESLGLSRFFGGAERLNYHNTAIPDAAHEVPAISGAFMLLPRIFYQCLKGLDEGYFLHMEDMDLCYRVHQAGGRVICMPEVKVVHFRSTSEVPSGVVEKHKARSFVRYLVTHFSDKHSTFFMMAMEFGIWARYALKRFISTVDSMFVPPLAAKQEIARIVLLYKLSRFEPQTNELVGKTILVTGASGQVGLSVIGKALAKGARVLALYNKTFIPFTHARLEWIQGDLTDTEFSVTALKADTLIHAAALWYLPAVLPRFYDAGIKRVVAFSSTSVLGKIDSKNKYEQGIVDKLKNAEDEVSRISAERNGTLTILRPTMIYGAGLDANITRMANVVRRFGFLPIYMPASGQRHPVQASDLANAALSILDNSGTYTKTYNLGGRQMMSYRTMCEMLFAYIGKPLRLIRLPFLPSILNLLGAIYQFGNINGEMALRMNRDLVFDIEAAIDDFGYRPEGFLQGDVVL